jgi:hypothetical protein
LRIPPARLRQARRDSRAKARRAAKPPYTTPRRRCFEEGTRSAVQIPCPSPGVPLVVVAGADVRVRRAQVPVEQRCGEERRSIVDVDICQTTVQGNRDLNRRRTPLFAIVDRIALVIDGVVDTALELPRAVQPLARVRRQSDVHPELAIARCARDFAFHRIDTLDERQGVAERLARRVGQWSPQQRMRHRVEGRLCGEPEHVVIEGTDIQALAGDRGEAGHPAGGAEVQFTDDFADGKQRPCPVATACRTASSRPDRRRRPRQPGPARC